MHTSVRFLLFLLLSLPLALVAEPLLLDDTKGTVETHLVLQHYEDKTRQLSIENVSSPHSAGSFVRPDPHPFNFGRNEFAHWIKFDISLQSNLTWYLVINSVILAEYELYILESDQAIASRKKNYKKIEQRLPTYRLDIEKSKNYTIFLRLSNKGKGMLYAPILLMNADDVQKKTNYDYLFLGSMMMGIITMAIYNLLLFIRLKDPNYLTLSLTQLAIILILQRVNNIIPLPENIGNPDKPLFHLVFFFFMVTSIILIRNLLNTKDADPIVDKFLYTLLILVCLFTPFMTILPRADLLSFAIGLVIAMSALFLMLKKLLEGDAIIKAFFLAASIFLAGSLPIIAWGLNLTSSFDFASNVFHMSTFASSIMMSLALAEKTRQMKQQTDQARAANAAKTEFLTTMSHELRTPMHAVMGVSSLLKLTPVSHQQRTYIGKLDTSSRHMMSIIERVLDLSRLENNNVLIEQKPFRLNEVMERVENLLSDEARQKELSLYMHSDYPKMRHLEGDPTRLSQVLLNLLGNAIKFTDKGYVTLLITPLSTEQANNVTLTFEVIDTGLGLTPRQQQQLFKPFSQVDAPRTRKRGGFGLGLAISHKLVRHMGGYLEVDSSLGNGSRFFFTLTFPVIKANKISIVSPVNPAQSLYGLRILLVDDDEINRFLGLELLQALEATVSVADSGKATLQLLQQKTFDLVLIDINMPEMDGYETTRRIRAGGDEKLPIVALTAHAISGERDRCLKSGMNDYLTKPFETVDLLAMIQFWTNQSQRPAEDVARN